ncbi:hypothetical protein O9992_26375 [Vibrio lentus]|nr:hypothetical protein [Vibrio lentus]
MLAFGEVICWFNGCVTFIMRMAPKRIENFSVSLFSGYVALSGIVGAVFSTSIALERSTNHARDRTNGLRRLLPNADCSSGSNGKVSQWLHRSLFVRC